VTPLAYQTPTATLLASLYTQVLQEELNEFVYNSQVAGLSYRYAGTRPHCTALFVAFPFLFFPLLSRRFLSSVSSEFTVRRRSS